MRRVGANPCIKSTIKHGSIMVGGSWGFCQMQSQGFALGEGQFESDQLSQHTTALHVTIRNMACGSRDILWNRLRCNGYCCRK